jgi:predicted CoA-binding protein/protein-tyrosine phosphatase
MSLPLAYSDLELASILNECRTVALVGASPREDRPSYEVMSYLLAKGYRVIPVNPEAAGARILGQRVHRSLAAIPSRFDLVDVFRRSELAGAEADSAIELAHARGVKAIWMQLGVRDDAAAARARAAGLSVVMDRCPKIEIGRLGLHPGVRRSLHLGYPIDWIDAGNGGGAIGMGFCPGNHYLEGRTRDLGGDLAAISAFGASVVISLMEGWELSQVAADPVQLQAAVAAYGMEWHHLPISDMGVPDRVFELAWPAVRARIQTLLGRGETVFFHCLAGLGRTGTVVARFLVEGGEDPEQAIERVRRARPGTIQTAEQEAHVRAASGAPRRSP